MTNRSRRLLGLGIALGVSLSLWALIVVGAEEIVVHFHQIEGAVVQLAQGPRLRGTLAWLACLALHLFYLLGGRNRVSTVINLTYRYVAWGHGGAVIVGDEPIGTSTMTRSR